MLLFSRLALSDSLQLHGLQHARLPWSLLKFMSVESVMPSNHLLLYHSFLLLPSIFPILRVFSKESALCINGQSIGVLASKAVLLMSIQG